VVWRVRASDASHQEARLVNMSAEARHRVVGFVMPIRTSSS